MQTFLPYPSFADSAAVLDTARLGKQRVETLQILRASLLPSYGWQSHPVTQMWRGHVPALTAYGLATIDAWEQQGHIDSTRHLIEEFAPEVVGVEQDELAARGLLPPWIGNEYVHRSHRSNLIRKAPEFYGPLFPGTPADLDYVWPEPPKDRTLPPTGRPLLIVRPRTEAELEDWVEEGIVAVGERSPLGRDTPKWRAQVAVFLETPEPGTEIGVLVGNGHTVHRATITGTVHTRVLEGGALLVRAAAYGDRLSRTDFAPPAALQDPRTVFQARLRPDLG
ncbi:MAG: hypothetical protein JWP66_1035 [Naasia sp.]|nr:hypothetical protein [Naasia sp.]